MATRQTARVGVTVLVAALGYFVDIYDLILFSIVRVPSLKELGVAPTELLDRGVLLLNMQMGGMLLGGIAWGMLGDKRGRLSVLFGSIFLYSVANIANGLVQSVEQYAWLRLVAGIGLAGELGAGITLVSEIMARQTRGYGTTIVATVGILGAVVAVLVGDLTSWRTAYFVGGGLGLALLVLRIGLLESGMFESARVKTSERGNFFALFRPWARLKRYAAVILSAVPIWYVVGILITFSPEIARAMGTPELPKAGRAVMLCYIGLSIGDLASGVLSQLLRTRKRVLGAFIAATALAIIVYFSVGKTSLFAFYTSCLLLGVASGYWAVFATTASEQFGTNLRATVTTTAPNFVRGAVVPLTSVFQLCKPALGVVGSAMAVGAACLALAVTALFSLEETYGKDLDFLES